MIKVSYGEVLEHEGIPVLEIKMDIDNDGHQENRTFYLAPFRCYKFQVSGTIEGQMDYGSGQVIGLKNITSSEMDGSGRGFESNATPRGIQFEILQGLANNAIMNFLHYPHFRGTMPAYTIDFDRAIMARFINESYSWIISA